MQGLQENDESATLDSARCSAKSQVLSTLSSSSLDTISATLTSARRVRNRLAVLPDDRLPSVLSSLLPRLLRLLDDSYGYTGSNMRAKSDATAPSSIARKTARKREGELEMAKNAELKQELMDILCHVQERVQILPSSIDNWPWLAGVTLLLECGGNEDAADQERDTDADMPTKHSTATTSSSSQALSVSSASSTPLTSPITRTWVYSLLSTGLAHCSYHRYPDSFPFHILSQELDRHHRSQLQQTDVNATTVSSIHWKAVSWLWLDCLALRAGLNYPHLHNTNDAGRQSTESNANQLYELVNSNELRTVSIEEKRRLNKDGAGVMGLLLDVMLYNYKPHGVAQSASRPGVSCTGVQRLESRLVPSESSSFLAMSDDVVSMYWRQLQLVCLQYAISLFCPYGGGAQEASVCGIAMQRALLLLYVTAGGDSLHGRWATGYIRQYVDDQYLYLSCRKSSENAVARQYAMKSSYKSAMSLWCCLLELVVGAQDRQQTAHGQQQLEQLQQQQETTNGQRDDVQNDAYAGSRSRVANIMGAMPTQALQRRPSLTFEVAYKISSVISQNLSVYDHMSRVSESDKEDLSYYVHLVSLIQSYSPYQNARLRLQLMYPLFQLFVAGSDVGLDVMQDVSWLLHVERLCLETSLVNLSLLADAENYETVAAMTDMQPIQEEPRPGGVFQPYGHRKDLNNLLEQHRTNMKKRQLIDGEAVEARVKAYEMIRVLCEKDSPSIEPRVESPVFKVVNVLFECSVFELATLHEQLFSSLDALLGYYTRHLNAHKVHDAFGGQSTSSPASTSVLRLLPCLYAACSSTVYTIASRLAVIEWCRGVLLESDPVLALPIAYFLSVDGSAAVREAAAKLKVDLLLRSEGKLLRREEVDIKHYDLDKVEDYAIIEDGLRRTVQGVCDDEECSFGQALVTVLFADASMEDAVMLEASENEGPERAVTTTIEVSEGAENIHVQADMDDFFTCAICMDEASASDRYSLGCNHVFCMSCWRDYISSIVVEDKKSDASVLCPYHKCDEVVLLEDFAKLVPDLLPSIWRSYVMTYVAKSGEYSKCPGSGCSFVSHLVADNLTGGSVNHHSVDKGASIDGTRQGSADVSITIPVTCQKCQADYCYQCQHDPHSPARCKDVEQWNMIFRSSDFWVKKNSKPCPGCHAPIEKTEGCNYMSCTQCQYAFCWICLMQMRRHFDVHECIPYDPALHAAGDDKLSLYYTDRYQAHGDAEKYMRKRLKDEIEGVGQPNWYMSMSEYEKAVRRNAFEVLVTSRSYLKYSYVAAWGLRSSVEHRARWEDVQMALGCMTERLSRLTLDTEFSNAWHNDDVRVFASLLRVVTFYTASMKEMLSNNLTSGSR
jgi:IBR domain, a half RING-finger domain/Zinc finger, C3HC4 type (RING finger)